MIQEMVGHETQRLHLPVRLGAGLAQGLEETLAVRIIFENHFPAMAAIHHVINQQAKFAKNLPPSETFRNESPISEPAQKPHSASSEDDGAVLAELRKENMDLKIANRGTDYFIEQLRKERESFGTERKDYVEKLIASNRKLGEPETRLLQLEGPRNGTAPFPKSSET